MGKLFNKTFFKFTAGFAGILLIGFVGILLIGYYGGDHLGGATASSGDGALSQPATAP